MERRCENCEYFREYSEEDRRSEIYNGACWAHPPQCHWIEDDDQHVTFSPEVGFNDWCGEFKPREEGK